MARIRRWQRSGDQVSVLVVAFVPNVTPIQVRFPFWLSRLRWLRIVTMGKLTFNPLLFLQILVLLSLAFAPLPPLLQTHEPPVTPTPDPGGGGVAPPTVTPAPTPTPAPGGISQIIHRLLFPAETIAEALTNIFAEAAENEAESLSEQAGNWSLLLGQVLQAPSQGYYQAIAQASLPVAAALAPALFLLRLAMYHWRRFVGEDDSALQVIGDWVAAGFLAIAAGPFLDLLTELGWWMAGATLGETSQLALAFVQSTTVFSVMDAVAQVSLFSGILVLLMAVGGILAMAGMLFAFGAANAALYVMAVVAAPIAVAGVLRHMRWLRALWIKAVAVLALLPVAAGGIFKASVTLGAFFAGEGLLSLLIRLLWLWGATGFLIALASILSKVTLSASVEALGQLTQGVKAMVSTAVLAGSVAATSGAVTGGIARVAAEVWAEAAQGVAVQLALLWEAHLLLVVGPDQEVSEAILEHYNQAEALAQQAGTFSAFGLRAPAQYARTQAHGHELAARKLELERRLSQFSGFGSGSTNAGEGASNPRSAVAKAPDFGFSRTVNQGIAATFSNTVTGFQEGFSGLSKHIEQAGFDPQVVAERYPEDTGRMVAAYLAQPERIDGAENPLMEASILGGADGFRSDIFGAKNAREISDRIAETPSDNGPFFPPEDVFQE